MDLSNEYAWREVSKDIQDRKRSVKVSARRQILHTLSTSWPAETWSNHDWGFTLDCTCGPRRYEKDWHNCLTPWSADTSEMILSTKINVSHTGALKIPPVKCACLYFLPPLRLFVLDRFVTVWTAPIEFQACMVLFLFFVFSFVPFLVLCREWGL